MTGDFIIHSPSISANTAFGMPHKEDSRVVINELHPTFAAEVRGVDFTKDVSPDVFDQIYQAITKVSEVIDNLINLQS